MVCSFPRLDVWIFLRVAPNQLDVPFFHTCSLRELLNEVPPDGIEDAQHHEGFCPNVWFPVGYSSGKMCSFILRSDDIRLLVRSPCLGHRSLHEQVVLDIAAQEEELGPDFSKAPLLVECDGALVLLPDVKPDGVAAPCAGFP